MSKRPDIFLRAHTVKASDTPDQSKRKKDLVVPERWPDRIVIFDTETRTTVDQALMFAFYRICRLQDDRYICEEEGIVYSGSLENVPLSYSAVLESEELNAIGNFVAGNITDVEVPSFPPKTKLKVYQSFPAFLEKVFWKNVRAGNLIVC